MTNETTTTQEETQTEQEINKTSCLNNNNTLIPALQESERFIKFLIKRFNLTDLKNYIVVINKTTKSAYGTFASKETLQHFTNTNNELSTITLNTLHLKKCNPYEVLTHELAHFINYSKNINDCSSNQYHNKHFKQQAELLLLTCEKTKRGYSHTKENENFNTMLKDFKANKEVFNVFQNQKPAGKKGSRLRLYMCSCGVKVRVGTDDFKALCLLCDSEFKKVGVKDD